MQLAVLFWFYRSFDVCENRLKLLRRLNGPELPIYALYGGPASEAPEAERRLSRYLDDFYAYPEDRTAEWKWINGDQLIAAWHEGRGRTLPWDTVVVVQWDMLVLRPVRDLFAGLRPGEMLLSGFRPAREVEAWWGWAKDDDSPRAQEREGFVRWLRETQEYEGELWCCLFIVAAFPRAFLDRYLEAGAPVCGFLEYKLPTLAVAFGLPVVSDPRFWPWWASDPGTRDAASQERLLNAVGQEASLPAVLEHLLSRDAIGLIHPYRRPLPPWLMYRPLARATLGVLRIIERWKPKA
jgi:hypothetical protein